MNWNYYGESILCDRLVSWLCNVKQAYTQYGGIMAVEVNVKSTEQSVIMGTNVTFMCQVAKMPLQYCQVKIPGLSSYYLNEKISIWDISYFGRGLESDDCGFTIYKIKEENHGKITCTVGVVSEVHELIGVMLVICTRLFVYVCEDRIS
ncbi:hypothetical protein ABEB36_005856 [Hypothenemus hampei]|uniref:Immunoglobulin V-set domain-containing protein n=1 Tax=Hypothenemus hampei TaxID=57062 RepID=A0ABD1EZN6_HYPHA